jgi:hypothetical protein
MERLRISADADSRSHIHGDTGELAAIMHRFDRFAAPSTAFA